MNSYLGTTSPYYINNGKLVTEMVGTPFEITVYKLGDKYYGARSNEFGYANYEIVPPIKVTKSAECTALRRLRWLFDDHRRLSGRGG